MFGKNKENELLKKTVEILEKTLEDTQKKNQYLMEMILGNAQVEEAMPIPQIEEDEEALEAGTVINREPQDGSD